MIFNIAGVLALVLAMPMAFAADPCPPTNLNIEWSVTCFDQRGSERRLTPEARKNLRLNAQGMAGVVIDNPREMVAIDGQGKVVIPDIRHTGDFDYPSASSGIGRFFAQRDAGDGTTLRKCGYFAAKELRIITPASFDHCQPFIDGEALACRECTMYCTEPDCQDSVLIGGQGFIMKRNGRIRKEIGLPALGEFCRSPRTAHITQLESRTTMLRCVSEPESVSAFAFRAPLPSGPRHQ